MCGRVAVGDLFFNHAATTAIYTLSLDDALTVSGGLVAVGRSSVRKVWKRRIALRWRAMEREARFFLRRAMR